MMLREVSLILIALHVASGFLQWHSGPMRHLFPLKQGRAKGGTCQRESRTARSRGLSLDMVFDFLQKRSEEGIAQLQNLAEKTAKGKLGEALSDVGEYVALRNKIDAENLRKLTEGLSKSRERLLGGIGVAFSDKDSSLDSVLEKIEEVLLQADIGAVTSSQIINDLKIYSKTNKLEEGDILPVLRERLIEALTPTGDEGTLNFSNTTGEPTVMFVIGANGMGKTTTIGKISARLRNEYNISVLLGACDTFRAAAVEQLKEWSVRANVTIEEPMEEERGGDPVPVVRRSVRRAKEEGYEVCIIDTSGRLSNNFELTEQLQNMKAAIVDEIPSAPHETLLVVDGSLGRNAVEQAAAWRKYVGVSGLAITKLDGTARGGFVVSVVKDLGLPVKFIGVGEKIDDLREFDPTQFVDALLGNDAGTAQALKEKANKMMSVVAESREDLDAGSLSNASGASDASSRLAASFKKSGSSSSGSEDASFGLTGSLQIPANPGETSSKRKKRPKPQSSKKKKDKKKSSN